MFHYFLFYTFLTPLEYLQDKIPKGPTGINYLTVSMLLFLFWFLFGRRKSGGRSLAPSALNILMILFLVDTYLGYIITFLTIGGVPSPFHPGGLYVTLFLQFVTGFILFWISANLLNTRKKIMWTLFAIAVSAPLVFRAFHNSLGHVSSYHYDHDMRITFPFTSIGSNELGCFFVYTSVFFTLVGFAPIRLWMKIMFWVVGGLYTYGVLYSFSRASQLGYVIALGCGACLRYRWLIIGFIAAAFTMDSWLPQSVVDRWKMTKDDSGEMDESSENRKQFWALAQKLFMESPLVGKGVESFKELNPKGMDAHNQYYSVLAEQGLIGFTLFVSIWLAVLKLSYDLWRRGGNTVYRHYGLSIGLITMAMIFMNLFGDRFSHLAMIGQYWILVGIGVRLRAHLTGTMPLDDEKVPLQPGSYLYEFFALPVGVDGLEQTADQLSGPPRRTSRLRLFRQVGQGSGSRLTGSGMTTSSSADAVGPAINIVGGPESDSHKNKRKKPPACTGMNLQTSPEPLKPPPRNRIRIVGRPDQDKSR
jgi:O-antigen ligase